MFCNHNRCAKHLWYVDIMSGIRLKIKPTEFIWHHLSSLGPNDFDAKVSEVQLDRSGGANEEEHTFLGSVSAEHLCSETQRLWG